MKKTITTLFFLALGIASIYAQNEIPSIDIADIDGNKVNFKELINPEKTYVVSFWATWCVPCKKELNNIKDLYPEWVKNFNVELIAVSTDDSRNKAKIKTYTSAENWAYRVVLDQNQDLMKAFGVQQIPFTMIINKGKVVYTHNSYQEGDEYELENQLNSLK